MKVLIIKMSSLGDVLHALPALTDAGNALPGIKFDWVVEESFAQLPAWHPLINKVIPVAFRRLRKTPVKSLLSAEWRQFLKILRAEKYDLVIDAQGLVKSAFITFLARGPKAGLNRASAWEPLASIVYQKKYAVDPEQHAVTRVRQLFAQALNYVMPATPANYSLDRMQFAKNNPVVGDYVLFLHGTTWATKLWPENYWIELAKLLQTKQIKVYLPWGNVEEKERAERIAAFSGAEVLPKYKLNEMIAIVAGAKAIVAVDTGLGHIAAALSVPTISLYGPTDPQKTGTVGDNQIHLAAKFGCAPCLQKICTYPGASAEKPACFTTVAPSLVWKELNGLLS